MLESRRPKAKTAVARLLASKSICPFSEMARLAQDDDTPAATKAQLWIQLARYCAPQLRAIEIIEPRAPLSGDAVKQAKQEIFGFSDE